MARKEPFGTQTNRRACEFALKAAEACNLRLQGYSFREIAEKLGYSTPYGAWRAVKRALDRLPAKDAEMLREIELRRTEIAMLSLYPKVVQGDCNAIKRWTDLIELRCRLLGLFPPQKLEHGVATDEDDPLFRLLDALARRVEARDVGAAAVPATCGPEGDTAE